MAIPDAALLNTDSLNTPMRRNNKMIVFFFFALLYAPSEERKKGCEKLSAFYRYLIIIFVSLTSLKHFFLFACQADTLMP